MTDAASARARYPVALELGFRPFFLGAMAFAVVTIGLWGGIFLGHIPGVADPAAGIYWHAHEMLYGYVMAVVAGFLLTAVSNWTGSPTLRGWPLLFLFVCWMAARLAWLPPLASTTMALLFDGLFTLGLMVSITAPVIRARQWRQMAVLTKVALLAAFNLVFYLGSLGHLETGHAIGIYGGFYLLLGLILTMARRVVPFFIERALPGEHKPRNSKALDIASLVLFLALFVSEVFWLQPWLSIATALGLFAVNAIRLVRWTVPGLWRNVMLWSLVLSLWAITLGFLVLAAVHLAGIPRSLAIHVLGVGGIGLITASMMMRVSLGHTGRQVNVPPKAFTWVVILLLAAAALRGLAPLAFPAQYLTWIELSMATWLAAFAILCALCLPILLSPRADS